MKPGARLTRRSDKLYFSAAHAADAAARESSASRNRMHAPELENAATEHNRGGVKGVPGGEASGRGRRGHSRTRAHSKSLVCYVRPPGAATGHRCRPATPKRLQRQRASTARITLVSCASSSTRNASLSSRTNKHSVSVTQAMRQLGTHYKHQHMLAKKAPRFGSAAVHAPHRALPSTPLLPPSTNANKCLQAVQRSNSSKQVPSHSAGQTSNSRKLDWQIGLLPSAECAPSQAMGVRGGERGGGGTLDRCRAQSREQHSPRSKRREHAASLAAPSVPIRCTSLKAFRHATHEQRQPAHTLARAHLVVAFEAPG